MSEYDVLVQVENAVVLVCTICKTLSDGKSPDVIADDDRASAPTAFVVMEFATILLSGMLFPLKQVTEKMSTTFCATTICGV